MLGKLGKLFGGKSGDSTVNGYAVGPTVPLELTVEEISLVSDAWKEARSHDGSEPGETIFLRIAKFSSPVGDMFGPLDPEGNRLGIHVKTLNRLMDKFIKGLRTGDAVGPLMIGKILKQGGKHSGVKEDDFNVAYWDLFAKALLDCSAEWGSQGKSPQVQLAWRKIVDFFMAKMLEGYWEERKRLRI